MIRAVIDTRLLLRALIKPQGTVGPLLEGLRDASYLMLYSDALLGELADVLVRPRLSDKYGLTRDDIAVVLSLILLRGEMVISARRITACRDPFDNMVLEAAVAGQADVIVSGDDDLLSLDPFEGIPMRSPAAFLRMLKRHHPTQSRLTRRTARFGRWTSGTRGHLSRCGVRSACTAGGPACTIARPA